VLLGVVGDLQQHVMKLAWQAAGNVPVGRNVPVFVAGARVTQMTRGQDQIKLNGIA
jgi:hypothetical protein